MTPEDRGISGAGSGRRLFSRKLARLVLRDERVDDGIEASAFHDLRKIVERHVDSMVRNAAGNCRF